MKDAADLLLTTLEALPRAARDRAPDAAELLDAVYDALDEQLSDCGRVLLPLLGIGQLIELPSRTFHLSTGNITHPELSYWQFDGHAGVNWLETALLYPFEHLDNWLVLVRAADLDRKTLTQLRPPMIPRLRKTLERLDWVIVDQGGHEGGRLERHEFLEILGDRPWLRIEHNPSQGVVLLQRWIGETLLERFSVQVDDTFTPSYWTGPDDAGDASDKTQCAPLSWTPDPLQRPLETLVTLDVLCDPYATLRRFLLRRFGVDIDRLGPGILWRDSPDELFEFDDEDDLLLASLDNAVATRLDIDVAPLTPIIDLWFEALVGSFPVHFKPFGVLDRFTIPDVVAPMRPPARQRNVPIEPVTIAGEPLFVAIDLPPDTIWSRRGQD